MWQNILCQKVNIATAYGTYNVTPLLHLFGMFMGDVPLDLLLEAVKMRDVVSQDPGNNSHHPSSNGLEHLNKNVHIQATMKPSKKDMYINSRLNLHVVQLTSVTTYM